MIVDIGQADFDIDDMADESDVSGKLRANLPEWIADIARDVLKYDIGLRRPMLEFRYTLERIFYKVGSLYLNYYVFSELIAQRISPAAKIFH